MRLFNKYLLDVAYILQSKVIDVFILVLNVLLPSLRIVCQLKNCYR